MKGSGASGDRVDGAGRRGAAPEGLVQRIAHVLDSYAARVVLSLLILVSILPLRHAFPGIDAELVRRIDSCFLVVFGLEFLVRLLVWMQARREGRARASDAVLLVIDFVAVLSFLPLEGLGLVDARYSRVVRLIRLFLLLGYWGTMVRDLVHILLSRQRRFQIGFVVLTGVILSLAAAIVHDRVGLPIDGGEQPGFWERVWWSFRQVQDPGNLVQSPEHLGTLLISLGLTFAGLLLFSFFVGIGTTAIEELMTRSRTRPVHLRGHTVVIGLGEHSHFLLDEFAGIYRKNLRPLRAAVLGPTPESPPEVRESIAPYAYRGGDGVRAEDLDRVDIARAKRVLILGTEPHDPDAAVVASLLATRDRNPDADVYPDLEHESSLDAARSAGGPHTHVIGSGSFVGNYIAQNVANPGIYRLYRQLLTTSGAEIYTYVFDRAERDVFLGGDHKGAIDYRALAARAHASHGVWLIGVFVAAPERGNVPFDDLDVFLVPTAGRGPEWALDGVGRVRAAVVHGVVGVALRWEDVRAFGRDFVQQPGCVPVPPAKGISAPLLERAAPRIRDVVILGDSRRIPRVVADLVGMYGPVQFDVRARESTRIDVLARDIVTALLRTVPEAEVATSREEGDVFVTAVLGDESARVRLAVSSLSDATRLVHDRDLELGRVDVLLFLPRTRGADALDGEIALDCLQLARLEDQGRPVYAERTRVLAMVQDPVKGDLLERRLDEMTGGPRVRAFHRRVERACAAPLHRAERVRARVERRLPDPVRPLGAVDPPAASGGFGRRGSRRAPALHGVGARRRPVFPPGAGVRRPRARAGRVGRRAESGARRGGAREPGPHRLAERPRGLRRRVDLTGRCPAGHRIPPRIDKAPRRHSDASVDARRQAAPLECARACSAPRRSACSRQIRTSSRRSRSVAVRAQASESVTVVTPGRPGARLPGPRSPRTGGRPTSCWCSRRQDTIRPPFSPASATSPATHRSPGAPRKA